mmetsp:Transcript_89318/g.193321  ORF Transcript_89318/g.193321 Transcript_89318/m.193321 type:complete len:391 (+) Transcript_89318:559-1731(+)
MELAVDPGGRRRGEAGALGHRELGRRALGRAAGPAAGERARARAVGEVAVAGDDREAGVAPVGAHERWEVHQPTELDAHRLLDLRAGSAELHRRAEAAGGEGREGAVGPAGEQLGLEEARPRDGLRGDLGSGLGLLDRGDEVLESLREADLAVGLLEAAPEVLNANVALLLVPGHLLRDERVLRRGPREANGRAELMDIHRLARHRRARPVGSGDETLLTDGDVDEVPEDEEDPADALHGLHGHHELPRLDVLALRPGGRGRVEALSLSCLVLAAAAGCAALAAGGLGRGRGHLAVDHLVRDAAVALLDLAHDVVLAGLQLGGRQHLVDDVVEAGRHAPGLRDELRAAGRAGGHVLPALGGIRDDELQDPEGEDELHDVGDDDQDPAEGD